MPVDVLYEADITTTCHDNAMHIHWGEAASNDINVRWSHTKVRSATGSTRYTRAYA